MKGKKYVYNPKTKKMVLWANPKELPFRKAPAFGKSAANRLENAAVKGKR